MQTLWSAHFFTELISPDVAGPLYPTMGHVETFLGRPTVLDARLALATTSDNYFPVTIIGLVVVWNLPARGATRNRWKETDKLI